MSDMPTAERIKTAMKLKDALEGKVRTYQTDIQNVILIDLLDGLVNKGKTDPDEQPRDGLSAALEEVIAIIRTRITTLETRIDDLLAGTNAVEEAKEATHE